MQTLFEAYTTKDHFIAKTLSSFNCYMIGGTAIDFWCTKLGLKKARSRSNNDLDFYSASSNKFLTQAKDFLKDEGFTLKTDDDFMINAERTDPNIGVDILIDFERLPSKLFQLHSGLAVMSPVFLFSSKFDRYLNTANKQRKDIDKIDLKHLLEIIRRLNLVDGLETILYTKNYGEREETILNTMIIETFR